MSAENGVRAPNKVQQSALAVGATFAFATFIATTLVLFLR